MTGDASHREKRSSMEWNVRLGTTGHETALLHEAGDTRKVLDGRVQERSGTQLAGRDRLDSDVRGAQRHGRRVDTSQHDKRSSM